MSTFDYDNYTGSSDYVSWNNPGDEVVGTIKEVREGSDYNGDACPELVLEIGDGGELTLTAGQAMLKTLLAEHRPQVGNKIRVIYTGDEKTDRGGTKKLFTLDVKQGQTIPEGPIQKALVDDESPF